MTVSTECDIGLPDFLVIGAMKAATTALAQQLAAQDHIFMAHPKEPCFFSDDPVWKKGLGWYRDLFAGAPSGTLKGEASTHYAKWPDHPDAPARAAEVLPGARLIYMVRHPVDRALSHAWHEIAAGHGHRTPDEVAEAVPALWQYGLYATQIARWRDYYPDDRILITASERFSTDPEAEFARILAFLGVRGKWTTDLGAVHRRDERYRPFPGHRQLIESEWATKLRRALFPKALRSRIRGAISLDTEGTFSDAVRRDIEDRVAPDLEAFGTMCGVDLNLSAYKDVVRRQTLRLSA